MASCTIFASCYLRDIFKRYFIHLFHTANPSVNYNNDLAVIYTNSYKVKITKILFFKVAVWDPLRPLLQNRSISLLKRLRKSNIARITTAESNAEDKAVLICRLSCETIKITPQLARDCNFIKANASRHKCAQVLGRRSRR